MILHLHSVVDLITNSSTEIYSDVDANSIVVVKKIVNSVLKATGSCKECNDLFDIKIIPSERSVDRAADDYMDENDIEYTSTAYQRVKEQILNGEIPCDFAELGGTDLSITAKDGVVLTENLSRLLGSIFKTEARRDG